MSLSEPVDHTHRPRIDIQNEPDVLKVVEQDRQRSSVSHFRLKLDHLEHRSDNDDRTGTSIGSLTRSKKLTVFIIDGYQETR